MSKPRFSNHVKLKCETALVINGKSVISIDFYLVTNLTKICKLNVTVCLNSTFTYIFKSYTMHSSYTVYLWIKWLTF